ncbi:MAG TPA: DUF6571 family protein [Jatrophihabitans sp.]|nr:DUF6571 family protein [Jatrophihabitans sp.]
MAMASINIPAMGDLASALDSAAAELPYDQYGFRTILSGVDVDASPASGLGKVAAWVEGQIPGVKRRLALAQAIEAAKPGFQDTVSIDESEISDLDPSVAQQLGAADAQKLKDSNGKLDPKLIAEIAKYQNDPYFAAGFAEAIPPSDLANVVIGASNQRDGLSSYAGSPDYVKRLNDWKKQYGDLLAAMGGTLATATRNTGDLALPDGYADGWVHTITAETPQSGGDGRYGQAAALSLLLKHGSYGTQFLNTVATNVYDYERRTDENGMWRNRSWVGSQFEGVYSPDGSQVSDPLAGIMDGLGHNPAAAQLFFNGGGNDTIKVDGKNVPVNARLKYLIQDRTWATNAGSDNGDGLGAALEAATTYFRDRSAQGKVSATIAGESFALIGSKTGAGKSDGGLFGIGSHEGWKMWDGMRSHVANMVASYAPDLMRVAGRSDSAPDDLTNGWALPSDAEFPPNGPWGAAMNRDLMAKILGTLGEDQKNIDVVLAGVGAAGKLRMAYALQQALRGQPGAPVDMITGDKYVDLVNGASNELAGTFGFVIDNGYQGDKDNQEFQKKRAEELSKALGMVLSMPTFEIPEGHEWTSALIDQARDVALEKIGEGPEQDAQDKYNETAGSAQTNLQHAMLDDLLQAGYLDKKYYDQAGPGYVPPPAEALKHDASGHVVHPPEFDFDSPAYQTWAREGHNLQPWLNTNVVGPFRDKFPALGAG